MLLQMLTKYAFYLFSPVLTMLGFILMADNVKVPKFSFQVTNSNLSHSIHSCSVPILHHFRYITMVMLFTWNNDREVPNMYFEN